jgi:hypothetical protein
MKCCIKSSFDVFNKFISYLVAVLLDRQKVREYWEPILDGLLGMYIVHLNLEENCPNFKN